MTSARPQKPKSIERATLFCLVMSVVMAAGTTGQDGRPRTASMPIDDATKQLLKQMAAESNKPVLDMSPPELREMNSSLRPRFGIGPEMDRVENGRVTTESGDFEIRTLVPKGRVQGVLIWYHGGGWVVGSIDNSETLGRLLADGTHSAVVLVGYRLASEHPFPIAADDAYAALEWTARNVERIAGARVPLIVAGDSAGGNLVKRARFSWTRK